MLTRRGFEGRNRIRRGLEGPELDALGHAVHAVNGRHESEDRSRDGVRIDASAPGRMAGFISQAEVSNAAGIRIAVQIVFAVDEVAEFNAIGFADSVADGVQLAVAGTFEDDFLVVGADQDFADPFVAFLLEREVFDFQRRGR